MNKKSWVFVIITVFLILSSYYGIKIHRQKSASMVHYKLLSHILEINLDDITAEYNIGGMRFPLSISKLDESAVKDNLGELAYSEYSRGHFFDGESSFDVHFISNRHPETVIVKTGIFTESKGPKLLYSETNKLDISSTGFSKVDFSSLFTRSSEEENLYVIELFFQYADDTYELFFVGNPRFCISQIY